VTSLRGQRVEVLVDGHWRPATVVTHIRGDQWLVKGCRLPRRYLRLDGSRRVVVTEAEIRARAAAPEPLCRCPAGVCYLHPSLTTCGMRERAAAPEESVSP
jgi:hypothetical protein